MLLVDLISLVKSIRSVINCHTVKGWERDVMGICEAMQDVEHSSCLRTVPPER